MSTMDVNPSAENSNGPISSIVMFVVFASETSERFSMDNRVGGAKVVMVQLRTPIDELRRHGIVVGGR